MGWSLKNLADPTGLIVGGGRFGDSAKGTKGGVSVAADPYGSTRESLLKYLNDNIGKVNTYQGELTADKTAQEGQSLDFLKQYTDSGVSNLRTQASGEISKTLSGDYDPTSSPYYQAVKAEAARNLKETQANTASNAAGGGRYWSGARLETQAKQATDVNDALNTLVYGMAEKERNNRLSIIPQAMSAAESEENIPLQKATALQTLGSLDRNIQQQRLDALYNEWNRANNTQPMAVANLAGGVQQAPLYLNTPSTPSFLQQLLTAGVSGLAGGVTGGLGSGLASSILGKK